MPLATVPDHLQDAAETEKKSQRIGFQRLVDLQSRRCKPFRLGVTSGKHTRPELRPSAHRGIHLSRNGLRRDGSASCSTRGASAKVTWRGRARTGPHVCGTFGAVQNSALKNQRNANSGRQNISCSSHSHLLRLLVFLRFSHLGRQGAY